MGRMTQCRKIHRFRADDSGTEYPTRARYQLHAPLFSHADARRYLGSTPHFGAPLF